MNEKTQNWGVLFASIAPLNRPAAKTMINERTENLSSSLKFDERIASRIIKITLNSTLRRSAVMNMPSKAIKIKNVTQ